jgi:transcription termination/antitermination protein NusA
VGEKVDVVQWRENIGQFIAEALGPAKVKEVQIDEETKTADVIVSEHQLSLAIGKEGQNARLAARLSGYKVDIRSGVEERGANRRLPSPTRKQLEAVEEAAEAAEVPGPPNRSPSHERPPVASSDVDRHPRRGAQSG